MTRRISIETLAVVRGSRYPAPFGEPCKGRARTRLGDAAGLSQFGVNLTRLPPGGWSSQRHWHTAEDEFVFIIEGEAVLLTDDGEEVLRAGDCAGFKAGEPNGHQLQNRTDNVVTLLEIGSRRPGEDAVAYPDIDLHSPKDLDGFTHKDGKPYQALL